MIAQNVAQLMRENMPLVKQRCALFVEEKVDLGHLKTDAAWSIRGTERAEWLQDDPLTPEERNGIPQLLGAEAMRKA